MAQAQGFDTQSAVYTTLSSHKHNEEHLGVKLIEEDAFP